MPFTIGQQVRVKRHERAGEFRGYAAIGGFCAVQLAGDNQPTTVAIDDVVDAPAPARVPAWMRED